MVQAWQVQQVVAQQAISSANRKSAINIRDTTKPVKFSKFLTVSGLHRLNSKYRIATTLNLVDFPQNKNKTGWRRKHPQNFVLPSRLRRHKSKQKKLELASH